MTKALKEGVFIVLLSLSFMTYSCSTSSRVVKSPQDIRYELEQGLNQYKITYCAVYSPSSRLIVNTADTKRSPLEIKTDYSSVIITSTILREQGSNVTEENNYSFSQIKDVKFTPMEFTGYGLEIRLK